ncbi:xylulokinase [Pseudooceanicola aestuarii]|uniref:xylulokinase n=1 Tax=Pseudooceanicola aestuarii TaxID=2697319 RepID=UPI0013D31ED3|nr:FGGY family carbohydrate kinase [Pseudooceanicola aestuarii]
MNDDALALGIDFGTSSVKVVALSPRGDLAGEAAAPYPTHRPGPHRAEQDPADWLRALAEVIATLATRVRLARVSAIGLSGQLNGIVRCDASGAPAGSALTWLDQRAEEETNALDATFGNGLYAVTGNRANGIAVAPKLRWLASHDPRPATRVMQVKDWIGLILTGVPRTERNEASGTLLMDFAGSHWDAALCDWAGVTPAQLSPIGTATDLLGPVTATAAARFGLPEGVPVVLGAGDTGALAVGCGAYAPGTVAVTLGTAGHVVAASPRPPVTEVRGMWRSGHVTPDRELWLGLVPAGALSMEWLRDIFALGGDRPDFDTLESAAANVDPLAVEAMFLPFLAGAGTPWNHPARAVLSGLDLTQGPGHLVRAVQTGVAHAVRASLEAFAGAGLEIKQVRLAEGGARSPIWCQSIADVTGRPVEVLAHGDTSAVGAALLAFAGTQTDLPPAEALNGFIARAVRPVRTYAPDPVHHAFHGRRHARFLARATQEIAP